MNSALNVILFWFPPKADPPRAEKKIKKRLNAQIKNVTSVKKNNHTEKTIRQLIKKSSDPQLIEKAFEFAKAAYKQKFTPFDENYIHHAVRVAAQLNKMDMDSETIAFGLLHDVLDDKSKALKKVELQAIEKIFTKDDIKAIKMISSKIFSWEDK